MSNTATYGVVTDDGSVWIGDLLHSDRQWQRIWRPVRNAGAVTMARRPGTADALVATRDGSVWTANLEADTGWERLWNGARGDFACELLASESSSMVVIAASSGSLWAATGTLHDWFDKIWDGQRNAAASHTSFTADGRNLVVRTGDGGGWMRSVGPDGRWSKLWDPQVRGAAGHFQVNSPAGQAVVLTTGGSLWMARTLSENPRWDRWWDDRFGRPSRVAVAPHGSCMYVLTSDGDVVVVEDDDGSATPSFIWRRGDSTPATAVIATADDSGVVVLSQNGSVYVPIPHPDQIGVEPVWTMLWDAPTRGAADHVFAVGDGILGILSDGEVHLVSPTDPQMGGTPVFARQRGARVVRLLPLEGTASYVS